MESIQLYDLKLHIFKHLSVSKCEIVDCEDPFANNSEVEKLLEILPLSRKMIATSRSCARSRMCVMLMMGDEGGQCG